MNSLIEVENLSRSFGPKVALKDVSMQVKPGTVYGMVGENGAGKTTLIKHILGLLRAETGRVTVFGLSPVKDTVGVLGKIGYLSEERDLPGWMRVDELLRYTQAFYPSWDVGYAGKLREQFGLDPEARVRNLSQGQTAKAGLLLALAHRPELLLLDEPSSGLDPIVRRDILEAIIRTVAEEGRTVLFSSHLLDEVERVSDELAVIHHGEIQLEGTLDDIKNSHREVWLRFMETRTNPPELPGVLELHGSGREWRALVNGRHDRLTATLNTLDAEIVEERIPSLDEIFVALVGAGKAQANT